MNTVVIEHVKLNEVPDAWRARLLISPNTRVTVRIEEEAPESETASRAATDSHPLFGLWQNQEDITDVASYARQLRAPRAQRED